MNAFETTAVLEDASHLTLRRPLPDSVGRECRVIVLYETSHLPSPAWPEGFLEKIQVTDPAFVRQPQGEVPPVPALDEDEGPA